MTKQTMASSLQQLLEHFIASDSGGSSVVEALDLPSASEAVFQRFADWCGEWASLEIEDVVISRPLLVLGTDADDPAHLTASLLTRFSSSSVYDASYASWQTPLPVNAWSNLQRLARLFGVVLRFDSRDNITTLIGREARLDLVAEKRILKRFLGLSQAEQRRYLEESLLLFLRQIENLCPFARDAGEERQAVDARVGGAVMTARLISECVHRLATADADTTGAATGAHLAEVFSAGRYTNCLHELLNAFEHL